jgi:Icc-related predicted phosphoesterase
MSSRGYRSEIESFLSWYHKQRGPTFKVWVTGNHDRCFDPKFDKELESPEWLPELIEKYKDSLIYLNNSSTEIMGCKIWGSPITPWFHGERWADNKQRGKDIVDVWEKIPKDTDIIVTHGPVAYKLDYAEDDEVYVGCEDLRKKVKEIKPKLHCCGHIHEAYGTEEDESTQYVNACICNLRYEPVNVPIVVKINI